MRAVKTLYEGAKTTIRDGLELSEEFKVTVGVHQESMLLPMVFAITVDLVTESVRGGTEGDVLEMKGGIQEQGAEGEPRENKSGSEWGRR